MTYRKKLIEVALPLDAINEASAREKSIRHGHPATLHMWWARRPLAACRAVIFASLVDDPSAHPEIFATEEAQEAERSRLFDIIRSLVKWENNSNSVVLDAAKREIERFSNGAIPLLRDPFCGGGSIPLEAQRLGLKAHGSDLNPVAVLITKVLLEIPPRFANQPPVNSQSRSKIGATGGWVGAQGLAEDVRYYGLWMCDEASKSIGQLYPKITLPNQSGKEANVIAWLWTRLVTCPNPACQIQMPLARSFWLSSKSGSKAWVEPTVDRVAKTVRFHVRTGEGVAPAGTVNRRGATCICCGTPVPFDYIRVEGKAGRMGAQMMAIVADGQGKRIYQSPTLEQEMLARQAQPEWVPETSLPEQALGFRVQLYGMTKHRDLFTHRQLRMLAKFDELVGRAQKLAFADARASGHPNPEGYASAVATYLAEAVSKLTTFHNTLSYWRPKENKSATGFGRQALSMVWAYAEANPFAGAGGDFAEIVGSAAPKVLAALPTSNSGFATQHDATQAITEGATAIHSTDPPYYDNVGYADLSDFFYVWLRHSLSNIYPELFSTVLVPKAQELIATPYRFDGSRTQAAHFFEVGLGRAFTHMREMQHPDYPATIYYAFKQLEEDEDEIGEEGDTTTVASTGWETMLEGLLEAGFSINGTWPMRTENATRMRATGGGGSNALASSIVLVCRPRPLDAPRTTRRDFLNALKRELPSALKQLQHGNIAPVDLAQATIGPGMAIFSRYTKVLEANGATMHVRTALQLINQALDEVLSEQEGEFDSDTRWAVAWFEQYGAQEGSFGIAETLSKAKNSSISGLVEAGLIVARGGKVRLLRRDELPTDWDPSTDKRLTVWETAQHLIRALERDGETGAAALLAKMGERGEVARDLAYRLYTLCERKGWADEALAYNSLVIAWQGIGQMASRQAVETPRQQEMFT